MLLSSPLVLVYFAAWIICLRSASLNWMLRASTCRCVSFSCLARVSWLLGGFCTAACCACFTKLDVTRVIRLARVARLTRYIDGPMPYASIICIARFRSAARALDLLCLAFRPSAHSSKGISHEIQDSSRKFSVCAQGSSVDSSMILLCLYIFIKCVKGIVIGIFVCCNILFCIAVKS